MISKENHSISSLIWHTQRALWCEVSPCFRGVAVEWQDNTIVLYFYLDGDVSDDLHDDCTSVGAEVIACYNEAKLEENIIQLNYPHPLPKHHYWVFRRHENLAIEENDPSEYLRIDLSVLYSLLGRILPSVRGVAIKTQDQSTALIFYIDGDLNINIRQMCEDVVQEARRLSPAFEINLNIHRNDYPNKLPKSTAEWIYLRKELPTLSDIYNSLLCGAQEALLDRVESCVRGVALEWNGSSALLLLYCDGALSTGLQKSIRDKDIRQNCEEVLIDMKRLNPTFDIQLEMRRIDYPTPIDQPGFSRIYLRKEPFTTS